MNIIVCVKTGSISTLYRRRQQSTRAIAFSVKYAVACKVRTSAVAGWCINVQ